MSTVSYQSAAFAICEDRGEPEFVIYATDRLSAKRKASERHGIPISEIQTCSRKSSLDIYAPGPAPSHALLDAGLHIECASDTCCAVLNRSSVTYVHEDRLFCSDRCRANASKKVA